MAIFATWLLAPVALNTCMFVHHPKRWVKASMHKHIFCCIFFLIAYIHCTRQSGCTSGLQSVTFGICMSSFFFPFCTVFQTCCLCGELNCTLSVQCVSLSPLHPFCLHILQGNAARLVCLAYLLPYKAQCRKSTVFDSTSWECMQIHSCVGCN